MKSFEKQISIVISHGALNISYEFVNELNFGILNVNINTNIDQTLVSALHGLLNCEIDGLDCRVFTTRV